MKRFNIEKLQQWCISGLVVIMLAVAMFNSGKPQLMLANLLTEAAIVGIIAIGMTFVIIAGGFDLSVGSIAAVCGCAAVLTMKLMPHGSTVVVMAVSILAAVVCGLVLGLINGSLIAYVGVNPFVVTLSTMFIFRGIGLVLTGGGQSQVVPIDHQEIYRLIYWQGFTLFGLKISVPVLIFIGLFLVGVFLMYLTRFGHYVYATGGNPKAAWLAGINTQFITACTYGITGMVCAVAALIWTGLSSTAQASDYNGKELIVIASVIVGGTPLNGGRGGLFTTLGGLLLLCTLDQLLTQFGIQPQYRQIVTGLIILAAVAVDTYFKKGNKS